MDVKRDQQVQNNMKNIQQQDIYAKEDQNLTPSDSQSEPFFYPRYEKLYHQSARQHQIQQVKRFVQLNKCDPERTYYTQAKQPASFSKPALVLDLDGSLLYSQYAGQNPDFKKTQLEDAPKTVQIDNIVTVYRKYLFQFLQFCKERFELIIWSAGTEQYVKDRIRHSELYRYISGILSRENCTIVSGICLKDLTLLIKERRPLNQILILDDNCEACLLNLDNALPIIPFQGQDDDELIYIDYGLPVVDGLKKFLQEEKEQDKPLNINLNFTKQMVKNE